jgi:hypothetical protein
MLQIKHTVMSYLIHKSWKSDEATQHNYINLEILICLSNGGGY